MSDTGTVLDRPVSEVVEPGDHERLAHIVFPADKLTEALIMGTAVEALCGKLWTPNRDPEKFPVCQGCIDFFENEWPGRPWKGRR